MTPADGQALLRDRDMLLHGFPFSIDPTASPFADLKADPTAAQAALVASPPSGRPPEVVRHVTNRRE